MAYADPGLPYELHVDASREGLGGVLYQEQNGRLRPVAYVSRSLTPAEKNYPIHKLEFLALKWTVVDKLRDYLYGAEFVVKTDKNTLTCILTSAKLDVTQMAGCIGRFPVQFEVSTWSWKSGCRCTIPTAP